MIVEPKSMKIDDLSITIYDFPKTNDILPMHSHTKEDVHITIISKGKFLVKYSDKEETANAGDIYDWSPNDPHEFVSLKPNSRIVNIVKNFNRN